ncbi:glucose-repressible alcohol dehydrogenase transcriptional effector [Pelomyxa schiedti]|nr:glucose-repressible alcohol dehydrogenase transcriptional effector [Pelomyxa schiedti]
MYTGQTPGRGSWCRVRGWRIIPPSSHNPPSASPPDPISPSATPPPSTSSTSSCDGADVSSTGTPNGIVGGGLALSALSFTFMTYNVLADGYAGFQKHCSNSYLNWRYRMPRILHEIRAYNPDILSLQEMDRILDIKAELVDYNVAFAQRPGSGDGCAIFFKRERYTIKKEETVYFNSLADSLIVKNLGIIHRTMTGNVALLLLLMDNATRSNVLIISAHLYWDPKLTDIKVLQAYLLMTKVKEFCATNNVNKIVFGGDLNSTPDSSVYHFLHSKFLPPNPVDLQRYTYKGILTELRHNVDISSVYECLGEPHTNFTPGFCGCLDYIWYTPDTLQLKAMLEPVTITDPQLDGLLPNKYYPSDHCCIAAQFSFPPITSASSTTSPTTKPTAIPTTSHKE